MTTNHNSDTDELFRRVFQHYKKFFYVALSIFLFSIITCTIMAAIFFIKNHDLVIDVIKNGYTFRTSAEVMIRVNSPVTVNSPVKKILKIPVKNTFSVEVPVKTSVVIPVEKNFMVELKKPIAINIDHMFPVKEMVPINFTAPVDTDVVVKTFGVSKKVHISGGIPIKFDVPIFQEFRVNDTFMLKINEPISIPISHVFTIPIETQIKTDVPVDLLLDIPLDTKIDTNIMIQGEVPVLIDFEINFDLLKGISVKGLRMNPDRERTRFQVQN